MAVNGGGIGAGSLCGRRKNWPALRDWWRSYVWIAQVERIFSRSQATQQSRPMHSLPSPPEGKLLIFWAGLQKIGSRNARTIGYGGMKSYRSATEETDSLCLPLSANHDPLDSFFPLPRTSDRGLAAYLG